MLALVRASIGLALVPKVARTLGSTGVKLQPFTLKPPVFSELTLVWRKRDDNPALACSRYERRGCLQLGNFTGGSILLSGNGARGERLAPVEI